MNKTEISERIRIWKNVYKRVHFFREMYPFSVILNDIFSLPFDYLFNRSFIRAVRNVTIAVTHRCNVRCKMCYFHKELKDDSNLSIKTYKQIIDSLKKTRPCIILTGGEPLLHPDLIDMVIYAKQQHLAVQIFTNGTLLNPDFADALIKAGLNYINFTLLGNEKSHSDLARSPDAYERFIRNLAYFSGRRNNTRVILNFTVTPEAIRDIKHAVELANRYNLNGLRIQHYNFLSSAEFEAQDVITREIFAVDSNTNEIERAFSDVSGMADQLIEFNGYLLRTMRNIPVQWAPSLTSCEIKRWYSDASFRTRRRCFYPWRGIFIDATARIYPCSKIYLELGRVGKRDVLAAWNSDRMHRLRDYLRKGLFPACARCCKL